MASPRSLLLFIAFAAAALWFSTSRDGADNDAAPAQTPTTDGAPSASDRAPDAVNADAPTPAATVIATLTSADASSNDAVPPTVASPPAPLPAWDARLVDVLPELRARADAGDVAAACHIGLALSSCAMHRDTQPSAAELRAFDPDDEDKLNNLAVRLQDHRRPGREKTCVGLREADLDLRFGYLQRAADAGVRAAMTAYVEGIPLMSNQALFRHVEWIEPYRQRTPRYITELLRRGDHGTARMLYMVSDGLRTSLVSQALELDEMSSATFWHLGRIVTNRPTDPFHGIAPERDRIAEARARELFARFYAARAYDQKEAVLNSDFWRVESCAEMR